MKRKKERLIPAKMVILLICLIALTISCSTVKVEVEPILIPVPASPEKPDLNTVDISEYKKELPERYQDLIPDGILFSYEDARLLLIYLNDIDLYKEQLELILGYYNGTGSN